MKDATVKPTGEKIPDFLQFPPATSLNKYNTPHRFPFTFDTSAFTPTNATAKYNVADQKLADQKLTEKLICTS
jgi:hypothetical protein